MSCQEMYDKMIQRIQLESERGMDPDEVNRVLRELNAGKQFYLNICEYGIYTSIE